MNKLFLIITDEGDSSVGIRPVSWEVECPFLANDCDHYMREHFKMMIINSYLDYSEGLITAFYSDETQQD